MQTCTVTAKQFNDLNYDKGACTVTDGKVVLNAATAKTCNFACKEGYLHPKGDKKIPFVCAHNGGVTKAEGSDNWGAMTKCQGA